MYEVGQIRDPPLCEEGVGPGGRWSSSGMACPGPRLTPRPLCPLAQHPGWRNMFLFPTRTGLGGPESKSQMELGSSWRDVGTPESAACVGGAWALRSVCVLCGALPSPTQAPGTEGCFSRLRCACGWERPVALPAHVRTGMGPSASAPPCPDLPDTSGHRAKQPGAGCHRHPPRPALSLPASHPRQGAIFSLMRTRPHLISFLRSGCPQGPDLSHPGLPESEFPSCLLVPALLSWGTFLPQDQGPLVP